MLSQVPFGIKGGLVIQSRADYIQLSDKLVIPLQFSLFVQVRTNRRVLAQRKQTAVQQNELIPDFLIVFLIVPELLPVRPLRFVAVGQPDQRHRGVSGIVHIVFVHSAVA